MTPAPRLQAKLLRQFGSVALYLLDTRRVPLRHWAQYLSAADRRDWHAIRVPQMAKLFLASRVMAPVLARRLNRHNHRLMRTPSGQPVLRHGFISISRSDPYVVFALAHQPIGLDLERIRHDDDLISSVSSCFAAQEQTEIAQSSAPASHFCRTWTRKEALAKRTGSGIGTDLATLDTLHPTARLRSLTLHTRYWLSLAR